MRRRTKAVLIAALLLCLAAVFVWRQYGLVPAPPPRVPLTGVIDRIVIDKSDRLLTVYRAGEALRSYDVALGFAPEGDKTQEGDGRTPEGLFRIDRRNPQSRFHLSLGLDYPQAEDILRAAAAGVSPGGDIFIHGQPNGWPATGRRDASQCRTRKWTSCGASRRSEPKWKSGPEGRDR